MCHPRHTWLAGLLAAAMLLSASFSLQGFAANCARPTMPDRPEECALAVDKVAEPETVRAWQPVTVSLVVAGWCREQRAEAVDVVLTLDTSGSMSGAKFEAAKRAAAVLLGLLNRGADRAGLVTFASDGRVLQLLSDDLDAVTQRLQALTQNDVFGGTDIAKGFAASYDVFVQSAARPANRSIVFLTDGFGNTVGLDQTLEAAGKDGILVVTIGLGAIADAALLRRMATDPTYYYFSPTEAELEEIYRDVAGRIVRPLLMTDVVIVDRVPNNFDYVPGWGDPIEPDVAADGRTLTWRLAAMLSPGLPLSYRVRPRVPGYWPTNLYAVMDYTDGSGAAGHMEFPLPHVRVLPRPLYLPVLMSPRCLEAWIHYDVVLDVSGTMAEGVAGQPTKLEAAKVAVGALLDRVDWGRDLVSVTAFAAEARVVATGRDQAAVRAAVEALHSSPGTRIDLGLGVARAEHERLVGRSAEPIHRVVVLSDGIVAPENEDAARAEAMEIRARGAEVLVLAVGDDANLSLLAALAGAGGAVVEVSDRVALDGFVAAAERDVAPCRTGWPIHITALPPTVTPPPERTATPTAAAPAARRRAQAGPVP